MRTRILGGFSAPWIREQQAGRAETQARPALALSVSPGSCPVHAATVGMLRPVGKWEQGLWNEVLCAVQTPALSWHPSPQS